MSNKKTNAIFIAATGQNVGKTTTCLGLISGLKKRYEKVGFIKPVGQQHVTVGECTLVDKDAELFKNHFQLSSSWKDISPVIIPGGFTRDFLDAKITEKEMIQKIETSFEKVSSDHDYTIVEGTGHVGVASIVELNNAKVASILGLDMVIIASGGLGSAYDELVLNMAMCEKYGVNVRGVILNRVLDNKRSMIQEYFPKALKKWGIPLIGCIPFNAFLSSPTIRDFENLFKTTLISGDNHRYRHFLHTRLVACSLETYKYEVVPNELVITPADREDIIFSIFEKRQHFEEIEGKDFGSGIILTGREPPTEAIMRKIQDHDIPTIYAPMDSYDAMRLITSYTAKIRGKDLPKIDKAISIVEENINFDTLCIAARD
jgi:phosphate acetyltransferase